MTQKQTARLPDALSGLAAALPPGIVPHNAPFCAHDYILKDPADMKAADDFILKVVTNTRAAMEPGAMLYVLMGEVHTAGAHVMLQTGLLDNLAEENVRTGNPALRSLLALEVPYNMISAYGQHMLDGDIDGSKPANDPLGHAFARAVLNDNQFRFAKRAVARRFAAALRHGIPVACVDSGRMSLPDDPDDYLDADDPIAARLAMELYGTDLAEDDVTASGHESALGMEIRNAVMAERTVNAAVAHDAKIVVLQIGNAHLGQKTNPLMALLRDEDEALEDDDALPFHTSCQAELAERIGPQDRILTLFCAHAGEGFTPEKMTPEGGHPQILPVILRGLAEDRFDTPKLWQAEDRFIANLGKSYPPDARPARFFKPVKPSTADVRLELVDVFGLDL